MVGTRPFEESKRGAKMSPNMVFTQGPLSLGKSFGHKRRNTSVTLYSDGDSGTLPLCSKRDSLV